MIGGRKHEKESNEKPGRAVPSRCVMRKGYGKAYGKRFGISGAGAAGAVCRSCHAPGRFSRGLFSAPVFCRKAL